MFQQSEVGALKINIRCEGREKPESCVSGLETLKASSGAPGLCMRNMFLENFGCDDPRFVGPWLLISC